MYWGASLEVQTPLYFLPKEIGIKLGFFVDAGSVWDYQGPTTWNVTGETLTVADSARFARRWASASSGIRRSVRCASIWPIRFRRKATTARNSSGSAAAPSSEVGRGLKRYRFGLNGSDAGGMSEPVFLRRTRGLSLDEIARLTAPMLRRRRRVWFSILHRSTAQGPATSAFLNTIALPTRRPTPMPAACLTTAKLAAGLPRHVLALIVKDPYRAFVAVARALYPHAQRPSSLYPADEFTGAHVHPTARLENGVTVEPGAAIGARAEIGAGSVIGANAVIEPEVRIGRDCSIGAGVTISNALIGDRVIIHTGCRIGQDGFGFVMEGQRHLKVPQVGRVIIQDDVEIGAGTTVDRGAIRDTVIGEGTKIDNQVQVGHNVSIGRHCIVVAKSGISGGPRRLRISSCWVHASA